MRADIGPDHAGTVLWATLSGVLALAWRPGAMHAETDEVDHLLETFIATTEAGLLRKPS